MVMAYIYLGYGVFVFIMGAVIKRTKDNWNSQPPFRRPVDIDKYTAVMSAIYFVTGGICLGMGICELFVTEVPLWIPLLLSVSYFASSMYNERKYGRKKQKK